MECGAVINRFLSLAVLTLTIVTSLAACGGRSGRVAPENLPPEPTALTQPQYRLGEGDLVSVNVWKNPDLSVEVPVRPDGFISVPLVGDVLAGGRTPAEIAVDTETKLTQFIRAPKVTVLITSLVSSQFQNRVRVVGAVAAPRSISHRSGMTVLDLVLEAGGLSDFASPQAAKLYRRDDTGTKVYPIYLRSILENGVLDTNYSLVPGDVVSVPERRF